MTTNDLYARYIHLSKTMRRLGLITRETTRVMEQMAWMQSLDRAVSNMDDALGDCDEEM